MQKWNEWRLSAGLVALVLGACGGGQTDGSAEASAPDVAVHGVIRFESGAGTGATAPAAQPARNIVVALVTPGGKVLSTGTTDVNGAYSLHAPARQTVVLRSLAVVQQTDAPASPGSQAPDDDPRQYVDSSPFAIGADAQERTDTVPAGRSEPFARVDARFDEMHEAQADVAPGASAPAGRALVNAKAAPDSVNVAYRTSGVATIGQPYRIKLLFTDVGVKGAKLTFKSDAALNLGQAEARTMPPGASSISVVATPSANGRLYFTVYARSGSAAMVIPVPVQVGPAPPVEPEVPEAAKAAEVQDVS